MRRSSNSFAYVFIGRLMHGGCRRAAEMTEEIRRDEAYDMIVMDSRGLGTIKQFVMGSVSQLHHASCPVTIIR